MIRVRVRPPPRAVWLRFFPEPAPFINLPIGSTEDRLLGGLHLERALKGEAVLKPGLLSEAHGGVLYVDEINLLPAHLGDALLDTAASSVNVIEREGLSASHASEFVLLGSMNPEEGLLRPQLLDRFAAFGRHYGISRSRPTSACRGATDCFRSQWSPIFRQLGAGPNASAGANRRARGNVCNSIVCSREILGQISATICERGVRSLRQIWLRCVPRGLLRRWWVSRRFSHHVETVLPLVLAHRVRDKGQSSSPPSPPKQPPPAEGKAQEAMERIFTPKELITPTITAALESRTAEAANLQRRDNRGPVVGNRRTEKPGGT